jgi:2-oxo-3-hexenedioate decarboxylase
MILDLGARNKQVGWKLGFGSPTGLSNLELDAPLVGYLLEERNLPNGAAVDIKEWVRPVGEAEVAIYFGRNIPSGASEKFVMDSVTAIGPAIELADLDFTPTDPTRILASDIFQRNYILGARDDSRSGGDIRGLVAQILMPDGREVVVSELEELIGALPTIVTHGVDVVGELSGGIKSGEFLIVGSIVPPIALKPGDRLEYRLGSFPPLAVNFE